MIISQMPQLAVEKYILFHTETNLDNSVELTRAQVLISVVAKFFVSNFLIISLVAKITEAFG